ncbi:MAG: transposase [endosymbiont of Escarpia spicata]|uniref:Transposase n=1 Tax=endosymbiont of Escarpia spicata TaxID=2200908 RepID=A0A370DAV3_9GAMM|nr:MAG: transposase [endosymbiont of Escarpia spicata]
MPNYRRPDTPGACWFFTVNLEQRTNQRLLVEQVDLLRSTIRKVKGDHPFQIDAIVILPEHLHAIWTLPPGDADFKTRWSLIKAGFSRALPKTEALSASRYRRGERGIWQRRFWEHQIRDEEDFRRHVDYIHWNPVKHGLAERVIDWPWSSFQRFVQNGIYPHDWGCDVGEGRWGE